jgi:membrane-bound lytic murein transglycosylase D
MSLEEFQRLNPSHNRPIIKPDTPVVIPADKLDTFRDNLENSQTPLTQWQAYTLTSAERLDRIAARFDTTAAELARVNGLSGNVRLGAGSTLLVPGNGIGLGRLLNATTPQHIIEPERSARGCGKAGKRAAKPCVAAKVDGKTAASAGKAGKAVARPSVKAPAKSASSKPAKGPAKVTKPGPGKRG